MLTEECVQSLSINAVFVAFLQAFRVGFSWVVASCLLGLSTFTRPDVSRPQSLSLVGGVLWRTCRTHYGSTTERLGCRVPVRFGCLLLSGSCPPSSGSVEFPFGVPPVRGRLIQANTIRTSSCKSESNISPLATETVAVFEALTNSNIHVTPYERRKKWKRPTSHHLRVHLARHPKR